jgi:hypothetical protein
MGEQVVVRHSTGTVTIEGGEVVVSLHGRGWGNVIRVPLAQATATVDGSQFVIWRNGAAVQLVYRCDPDEMAAFVEALDEAKRALAMPIAACPNCTAPGQRVGQPCHFCGVAVAG